jgi:hypothetical protein
MVQEGFGAVNDWLQRFSDRLEKLEKKIEERHLFVLSRLKPSPKGQVGGTALPIGRTNLPLRIVADPSFRAFHERIRRGMSASICRPLVPAGVHFGH